MMLGIGFDNCVGVKADELGRMDPTALEAAVQQAVEGIGPPCICLAIMLIMH